MTYTGPGQAERTSAGWSNQPTPPTGQPAEFGSTTYTYAALGLMSRTDTLGTTYYTHDPSGLPVSERTPAGTYYFLFDGRGDVAMLVDPPDGDPVAITSPCPTGNQSGDQWQAPGTHALDELLWQAGGAFGAITDTGTGNLKFGSAYLSSSSGVRDQLNDCLLATPAALLGSGAVADALLCGGFGGSPGQVGGFGGSGGGGGGGGGGADTLTFYRGTPYYDALGTVQNGAFDAAVVANNQGVYITSQFATAVEFAKARGDFGRNGGPGVIGIRVSAGALASFVASYGIAVETAMANPIVEGATETFLPSVALQDFYKIATFFLAGEPA